MNLKKILVLGAGNFGTCLAQHLSEEGYPVTLWTRDHALADSINLNHKNYKYLNDTDKFIAVKTLLFL